MADILLRSSSFVASILLGYALRRLHFFEERDFYVISKIVLKITLPAAVVSNFAGSDLSCSMLLLTVLGAACGLVLVLAAVAATAGKSLDERALHILCIPGFNVGNFTLPFVQSFLGPAGVITTSIFDVGNAFICLGGTYGLAAAVKNGRDGISFRLIPKMLFRSVPFDVYLVMAVCAFCGIALPAPVISFAGVVGGANAFLAMLMIGVGFKLSRDRGQWARIFKILGVHYGISIPLAVGIYLFLPIPPDYRKTLVLLMLSPIASSAPAFSAELGCDFGLASAASSISIIISIVLIISALLLLL